MDYYMIKVKVDYKIILPSFLKAIHISEFGLFHLLFP